MDKFKLITENQYEFYDFITNQEFYIFNKTEHYSYIQYSKNYKNLSFYPGDYIYRFNNLDQKIIDDLIVKIKAKSLPCALWVEVIDKNKELLDTIECEKGILAFSSTGMYMDIDKLNEIDYDNNIEIKLVDNLQLLTVWANTLINSWWTWQKGQEHDLVNIYKNIYLNHAKLRLYVAYYQNKPVGTSLGHYTKDSVGLYLVATHKDYQNRGIGKRLTEAPILDGRKKGLQYAVLHASGDGERVYQKLGFEGIFKTNSYWFDTR